MYACFVLAPSEHLLQHELAGLVAVAGSISLCFDDQPHKHSTVMLVDGAAAGMTAERDVAGSNKMQVCRNFTAAGPRHSNTAGMADIFSTACKYIYSQVQDSVCSVPCGAGTNYYCCSPYASFGC